MHRQLSLAPLAKVKAKNEVQWGFILCIPLVCPVLCSSLCPHPLSLTGPLHLRQGRAALWHRGITGMEAPPSQGELAPTWDASDLASNFLKTKTKVLTLLFPSALTVLSWVKHCRHDTLWSISSIAGNSPCGCTGNCKCFYTTAVIPQESQSPTCVTTSRHPNVMPKHFICNFPASVQRGLGSLQLRI